jgi:hypothetical protein
MLAMADRVGRVWASLPGLANRARVPLEDAKAAIDTFLAPDPYSRTPDFEGRRIEPIDGGWRLLNHEKYRQIRDEEVTKEAKRNYINERRARERAAAVDAVEQSRTQSNFVGQGRDNAEADTEAEAKETKTKRSRAAAGAAFVVPAWVPSEEWDAFVEHRKAIRGVPFTEAAKKGVVRELEKLTGEGHDAASLLQTAVTRGWRTVFPPAAQKATQRGSVSEAGMATYANGISLKTRIFGNESN